MKKITAVISCCILLNNLSAQSGTLFIKGDQTIHFLKLKEMETEYRFTFFNSTNQKTKSSILKFLIDSVVYNVDSTGKYKQLAQPATVDTVQLPKKTWHFTTSIGFSIGNVFEFNDPYGGPDKKSLSGSLSFDGNANYKKEGKKLAMTHELHYLFGVQKNGLTGVAYIQKVQDDLNTLHDISWDFKKNNKWNFNVIIRTVTSLCGLYDGDYFANYTGLGRIKGFASPYEVTVSPGIKYQPNDYLRISLSPYSFQLYGIKKTAIAGKGIYITDTDAAGNFKRFLYKGQGAELNFWYDRHVKQWLEMQYRLAITANYFENLAKNGLLEGLFITRIKLTKDFYLTHRLTLKNSFSTSLLKPYLNQAVLLCYSKLF